MLGSVKKVGGEKKMKFSFSLSGLVWAVIVLGSIWLACRYAAPMYIPNWYAWFGPQWVVYIFDIGILLCIAYSAIDKK